MGECVSAQRSSNEVEPRRGSGRHGRPSRDVERNGSPQRDLGRNGSPQRDFGRHDRPQRDLERNDPPERQRRIVSPVENLQQQRRQNDGMGAIEEGKSRFCIYFKVDLCNNNFCTND